jgi:aspartyl-tRNA(Asn)/glutamyl-tRNA(Gln) amidotransferase subunit C
MKLEKKQIEHVAHLARLSLSSEELEKLTIQIDNILSYVQKLDELDTQGVATTTHAFSVCNAFRDDVVQVSLSQGEALMNAPQQSDQMFQVPKII